MRACVCVWHGVFAAGISVEVPLPTLHANYIQEPDGMRDLALTAIHYNVASDVLRQKGLLLTTPLNIRYKDGDFVHRGNIVSPATVSSKPQPV